MKKAMKQSTISFIMNVTSVVLLLGVLISFFSFISSTTKMEKANQDRYNLTYNANRFMNGSAYLTSEVRSFAATGNTLHYDNYWNEVNNLRNRDIGVENMEKIGITQQERAKIEEMSTLSNNLVPLESQAMEDRSKGKEDQAIQAVFGNDYQNTIDKINTIKTEFLQMLDERTQADIQKQVAVNNVLKVVSMFFIFAVAFIQLINQIIVKRNILRPIKEVEFQMQEIAKGNLKAPLSLEADTSEIGLMVDALQRTKTELNKYITDISQKLYQMADGDLRVKIAINYQGDFKPIKKSLEKIVSSMNNTLSHIHESSEIVTRKADELQEGTETFSQGATRQASSVSELVTAITNLANEIKDTFENAKEVKDTTFDAESKLGACNEKMQEMITAIQATNEKSNEIGKIIKTIEDIAFQTNILALNAAVEAARAGQAGKGFAVVADEVRNLANKSREAAKNTTQLVEGSIEAVENSTRIANETAQAMKDVVGGARAVGLMVEKISDNAQRQAQNVTDIKQSVSEISDVVHTNSSAAEETATISSQLTSQAQQLQEQINQFVLNQEEQVFEA